MVLAELDFRGTERFVVRRRLGAGTLGVVYEAEDRERGQLVALKALRGAEPSDIYRLKKEFRTLVDVSHPNLVSLYELIASDDAWFFTMELIDGTDFLTYVRAGQDGGNGTSAEERLRATMRQLTTGVAALHRAGRLHRDLKPSNVMTTHDGRVVILDFGISAELQQPIDPRMRTAETGLWGTPVYMAPEQFLGEGATEATDWYAVGTILYEALTGQVPFTGRLGQIMMAKSSQLPLPPATIAPDCPRDLADLAMALLARDPHQRPTADEILRRLAAEHSTALDASEVATAIDLIGRQEHIAALEDAYRTSIGASVTVYIRGPSGIGKSTLVQSFVDRVAQRDGAVVLSGKCYARESVPHKALDGIVDGLSRYLRSLDAVEVNALVPEHVSALLRTFPVLQRVDALATAEQRDHHTYDAIEMRRAAFRALRELFGGIARRRPLILAIDDLQWADEASVRAGEEIVSGADAPHVLLIASFRSEEVKAHPFLQAAVARGTTASTRQLVVAPLTHDETVALVDQIAGAAGGPLPDTVIAQVARESAGSPFLAEQLARYVQAAGASGMGRVSLGEMLDFRIAQLPPDARPFLVTLAVAGRPLDEDLIRAAAQVASPTNALVIALAAAHLIRSSVSARQVEMYHDRIRETLAAQIPENARRDIHLHLAETLERHRVEDAEALFEHYLAAGIRQKAALYAARAARNAAATLAFDRAVLLYKRAIELASPTPEERGALQAELAEALMNSGRMAEAARAFEAAALADSAQALEYHRRAAEQFLMGGHTDDGLAVLRGVLDGVGLRMPEGPKWSALLFVLLRARLALRGMGYVRREVADIPPADLRQIDICWAGAAGLSLTDPVRALYFQTLYILLSLRAGEPHRIARAYAVETGFSAAGGGRTRARTAQWQQRAASLARELADDQAVARLGMTEGVAAFLVGEWRRAASLAENAERLLLANPTGMMWELATARNFWVSSTTYLGDIPALARRVPMLLQDARERGNQYFSTQLRIRGIILWLAHDDPERGRAEVDDAIAGWSTSRYFIQHFNGMNARVQVDLYADDAGEAWQRVMTGWQPLQRSLLLRVQMLRVEAMFLRARAALSCAAQGIDVRAMLDDAERTARDLEKQRMSWTAPMVHLVRGARAALRREDDAARTHLDAASRGFEAADMLVLAAAAKRRRGQMTGGGEGTTLVQAADAVLSARGVVNPERLTAMLAPGYPTA
jgi:hypothetical protein